ncbi:hypothetical protein BC831DRAFT_513893 [Entophlyctis helioformis]|nr:hypothetical protein BC831DRAFT_513893 [Entophlyctis helioformis]
MQAGPDESQPSESAPPSQMSITGILLGDSAEANASFPASPARPLVRLPVETDPPAVVQGSDPSQGPADDPATDAQLPVKQEAVADTADTAHTKDTTHSALADLNPADVDMKDAATFPSPLGSQLHHQDHAMPLSSGAVSAAGSPSKIGNAHLAARQIHNAGSDGARCYCGEAREDKRRPLFHCIVCGNGFHQSCIDALKAWSYKPLLGDDYYQFTCRGCGSGQEVIRRLSLSWVDVVHLVLFNLCQTMQARKVSPEGRKFYHWKQDICTFIESNWDILWLKSRAGTWRNSVASCLSTGIRFISGTKQFDDNEQGLWALEAVALEFPSTVSLEYSRKLRPVAYDIAADGSLIEDEARKDKKRKKTEEDGAESATSGAATGPGESSPIEGPAVLTLLQQPQLLAQAQAQTQPAPKPKQQKTSHTAASAATILGGLATSTPASNANGTDETTVVNASNAASTPEAAPTPAASAAVASASRMAGASTENSTPESGAATAVSAAAVTAPKRPKKTQKPKKKADDETSASTAANGSTSTPAGVGASVAVATGPSGAPLEDDIDPATAIMIYPDVDNPRSRVVISDEPTHTAPQVKVFDSGHSVSNEKGYRMAKASHGVWDGYWYFEVKINEHSGNSRIGWAQISGDLQAPCGYDQFGYSYRDKPAALFHRSKKQPMPEQFLAGYGDVLGLTIFFPPSQPATASAAFLPAGIASSAAPKDAQQAEPPAEQPMAVDASEAANGSTAHPDSALSADTAVSMLASDAASEPSSQPTAAPAAPAHAEILNVDPELMRRLWDPARMLQYMPFHSKPLATIPGSEIRYYKNGQPLGVAFRDLVQGKYHPAISLFKGGNVTANFGPKFAYTPPDGARPFCEVQELGSWAELRDEMKRRRADEAAAEVARKQALRMERKRQRLAKAAATAAANVAANAASAAPKTEAAGLSSILDASDVVSAADAVMIEAKMEDVTAADVAGAADANVKTPPTDAHSPLETRQQQQQQQQPPNPQNASNEHADAGQDARIQASDSDPEHSEKQAAATTTGETVDVHMNDAPTAPTGQ